MDIEPYKNTEINRKIVVQFERAYIEEKERIICEIIKILKEKYKIDYINGKK